MWIKKQKRDNVVRSMGVRKESIGFGSEAASSDVECTVVEKRKMRMMMVVDRWMRTNSGVASVMVTISDRFSYVII